MVAFTLGVRDHLVAELGEAGPAAQQQDRDAELHAELRGQVIGGAVVDQRVRHVPVGADPHFLDVLGAQVVHPH
jgi:hypothetical protein